MVGASLSQLRTWNEVFFKILLYQNWEISRFLRKDCTNFSKKGPSFLGTSCSEVGLSMNPFKILPCGSTHLSLKAGKPQGRNFWQQALGLVQHGLTAVFTAELRRGLVRGGQDGPRRFSSGLQKRNSQSYKQVPASFCLVHFSHLTRSSTHWVLAVIRHRAAGVSQVF